MDVIEICKHSVAYFTGRRHAEKSSVHCAGTLITPTFVVELPNDSERLDDSAAYLADWIECSRTDDESWLVRPFFSGSPR